MDFSNKIIYMKYVVKTKSYLLKNYLVQGDENSEIYFIVKKSNLGIFGQLQKHYKVKISFPTELIYLFNENLYFEVKEICPLYIFFFLTEKELFYTKVFLLDVSRDILDYLGAFTFPELSNTNLVNKKECLDNQEIILTKIENDIYFREAVVQYKRLKRLERSKARESNQEKVEESKAVLCTEDSVSKYEDFQSLGNTQAMSQGENRINLLQSSFNPNTLFGESMLEEHESQASMEEDSSKLLNDTAQEETKITDNSKEPEIPKESEPRSTAKGEDGCLPSGTNENEQASTFDKDLYYSTLYNIFSKPPGLQIKKGCFEQTISFYDLATKETKIWRANVRVYALVKRDYIIFRPFDKKIRDGIVESVRDGRNTPLSLKAKKNAKANSPAAVYREKFGQKAYDERLNMFIRLQFVVNHLEPSKCRFGEDVKKKNIKAAFSTNFQDVKEVQNYIKDLKEKELKKQRKLDRDKKNN